MINGLLFVAALLGTSEPGSIFAKETVAGATLNIEVRQPVSAEKAAEIIEWVRAAASHVNQTYGRFPSPSPRIVVTPSTARDWGSDSAVIYGRVTRNRGETVELFVNPDRPIDEFYDSWVATHEFSHLMLPLLGRRHRWISEGFASYYQNILLSRAGRYTPEMAWTQLSQGFARGRDSRPELSPNDAAGAGMGSARMKIYWSGAAIALLADVELRKRSGGTESLDTVLGKLQACCLPASRRWSGTNLFARLDSFVDSPVFMPLYNKYANKGGFPDLTEALENLGVVSHADGVALRDDAPLADIRKAID